MENDIPSDGQAVGGDCSYKVCSEEFRREAKARLAQLRLDSYDILYSLAITGRQRVWGIMIEETGTFQLLWYDPEHTVYPVSM